eukprot:m.114205 g.114205  ORF g.114205 m.114205 type:complete len:59 (+) comp14412_c0_seq1:286-462(+)
MNNFMHGTLETGSSSLFPVGTLLCLCQRCILRDLSLHQRIMLEAGLLLYESGCHVVCL